MTGRLPPWRIEREPAPRFTTVFNYKVLQSFAYEGQVVAKGEVLDGNGSLVRDVLASRPDLLEVTKQSPSCWLPYRGDRREFLEDEVKCCPLSCC
jgi:hypothetical protein